MIVEVRNAFKDNVNAIPWMDKNTKMVVMEKVCFYQLGRFNHKELK